MDPLSNHLLRQLTYREISLHPEPAMLGEFSGAPLGQLKYVGERPPSIGPYM